MMQASLRLALVTFVIAVGSVATGWSQDKIPEPVLLWPEGTPNKVGDEEVDRPHLRIYPAPKDHASGTAIVVCPGGGYGALAVDHEGHQVARWLNTIGVTAIVLKYRLGPRYRHPAPLEDARQAIRYVRSHAAELGVVAHRVGIMGFSAGGHLASTVATHLEDEQAAGVNSRPDFAVLCYPVISFTAPFSHRGSARNLLGENATEEQLRSLSNDQQVTSRTPPTFLFHTNEDAGVPPENSVAFYLALRKANVPAELHIYGFGPHGVGLSPGDPATFTWKDRLADWLRGSGFLADVERAAAEGSISIDGEPLKWGVVTFEPADSKFSPVAFGMVRNGRFSIGKSNGPVLGSARVKVTAMGDIEPQPTSDNYVRYEDARTVTIEAGSNTVQLDLKSK